MKRMTVVREVVREEIMGALKKINVGKSKV